MLVEVQAAIGNDAYRVTISDGNHQWFADEPAEKHGTDMGPEPEQLLLSSLGACTAITLRMYANRKEWPLESVDVRLNLQTADGQTEIARHITLHGALNDEQRKRLLQIANACPVHKILTGKITVSTGLSE